MKSAMI